MHQVPCLILCASGGVFCACLYITQVRAFVYILVYTLVQQMCICYIYTYLHFCVAWLKIRYKLIHNAFHSTLLAEWNEKKTHARFLRYLGEKKPFPFSCGTTFHHCGSVMAALA